MPDLVGTVLTVALVGVAVALLMSWRRARSGNLSSVGVRVVDVVHADGPGDQRSASGGMLVVPTHVPDEVFVFGTAEEASALGQVVAEAPKQLSTHAQRLKMVVDGVRTHGEISGRLVRVDKTFSEAMKAGKVAKDSSGQFLAITRGSGGKFTGVARISAVGKLAAVASMTNALSAMALQAQLDRIERQLASISAEVETVHMEQMRQWHAELAGVREVVGEVYRSASAAGELTSANWNQLTSHGATVRKHVAGDRDRLADAVRRLAAVADVKDLKKRVSEISGALDGVVVAHQALVASTRVSMQWASLRVWHFTVEDDAAVITYTRELTEELESTQRVLSSTRDEIGSVLERLENASQFRRTVRPIARRRLRDATRSAKQVMFALEWEPLVLDGSSSSTDVEISRR